VCVPQSSGSHGRAHPALLQSLQREKWVKNLLKKYDTCGMPPSLSHRIWPSCHKHRPWPLLCFLIQNRSIQGDGEWGLRAGIPQLFLK
jgi:hypothetical protein